jgi:O-antigen/teichoic acid export membrane protein
MNKYKAIAINTIYVMMGTVGSKLIYLLMLPLYTRWLTSDEYGAADTITVYADILVTIMFLNIADSMFVYPKLAENIEKKKEYFSSGIFFLMSMSALGALFFLIISFFKQYFPPENVFVKYRWYIFLLLSTRHLQLYVQQFSRSLDKLGVYSFSGVVLTASVAIFSFLLIPYWGVYGYVSAIILSQLASTIYTLIAAHEYNYISLQSVRKEPMRELLSYSVPLVPNSVMWWLINGINRPLMENKLGLVAIGIYAVASRISGVINSISSIFGIAWSNSVLDEYGKEGFDRFYNNYFRLMTTLYFIGCIFLVIFSEPIIHIFTTPEYYSASKYIPLLALGLCFSSMSGSIGSIFSAVKKSKYFFYSSLWGGVTSLTSLIVLMPLYGLYGVALSLSLSFLSIMIARWIYASNYVRIFAPYYYIFLLFAFFIVYSSELLLAGVFKYGVEFLVVASIVYCIRKDLWKMYKVIIAKHENRE